MLMGVLFALQNVKAGVVEACSSVIACASPEYSRVGSNAQKEWIYALMHKTVGKDLVVVHLDGAPSWHEGALTAGMQARFLLYPRL